MSVDILAIGNNNRKKQEQDMNASIIQPAWIQKEKYYSENMMDQPEAKVTVNPLDRQVEIGVGAKITPMSRAQKQQYADSLSDYKRAMMQRYKAEGYSFEASKELVNQMDELANPNAKGIDKYKDYVAKEQYYNRNGGTVDPDSTLYKVGTFLQKIGFNDQEKNPLNKLSQDYMQWYANEREAVDTIMEDEEANLAERFGWWLQRSLLSAEAGIIGGLGQIGNAVTGVEDIKQSAMTASLDRLIKGYDTDLDFYREDDRRLDEYLWEGASGGVNTLFWAWAPKIMIALSALGETKAGEWTMEKADGLMKKIIGLGLSVPGISDYYKSLDEQGQEDMLDTLTTLGWRKLAKMTGKWTGKMKISRKYQDIKNQFKVALDRGIEGAKEQAKAEVKNVKEATDIYNEGGKKIGSIGPEGEVGAGKSVSRIVKRGVDEFKQSFIDRYNARQGDTVAGPGAIETDTEEPVVGKPTSESKGDGVIQKGKDIVQEKWTDITTGLTPEERIRIQNDPYVSEKFNKALGMINEAGMPLEDAFITEQLYNEVGEKILQVFDEWENKLQNTLPEYKALRELNTTYNLIEATPLLTDLLLKNDITQDPVSGELDFSNSKFVSDADMRSVQRAIDMIYKDIATLVTPRQYLNLRDKLDQLAKYTTVDASRGQGLIRQIRHTLDGVAKKQIPGLKELDDTTSKYFKEIAELKDGWVYKGGDRKGEIRNNFYSIIKNLTGQNRHVMLQRLEKYYPGVTEEIEAIHLTNKLIKAYNKAPQIVTSLGIGGAIGGGIGGISSGWAIVPSLLGAIIGEMINKGIIEPGSKKWRRKAINKLLSEMSPEAQAKLEEIARRQTYAKEISAEDQRILDGVAEIIIQERNRGLSEEAIRERERRTRPLDQEALPGVQPDIVDAEGNITLGRGNVISPEKGPGRARRITRINEINLRNPETTPDKQVLDLQEKLDIDTDTAREIQSTIDDFLKDVGADEGGTVGGREVNYEKFTTRSLEKLMDNENLPRTEKDKIKDILTKRGAEEEAMSEVKADWDFAMRIRQLSEEEQRIGKVGKNKVSKEVADKQMREWEKKKEALTKEMQDYYGIDQFEASDKYLDMEAKGDQYIREYKRSNVYKTETAEREVLDSLMEGWSKQPKFVRDMNDTQLKIRQDFINDVELQNGYKLETTDYNDRYILEDNGNIVDRGAIKYLDNGTIEITAQTFDGIKESGILDYLPDNTEIKEAGSELWMSARELKEYPLADTWVRDSEGRAVPISEVQNYYDFADETLIDKFNGELTEQQIQEGNDLYQLASESLTPETENEIIEARGKFLTLNQRPGYTKALGLDQGEVNKTIMSWQRMSPELKKFVDKVHSKAEPKYRFMGISNWIERDNPWRGIDSLKFLTEDVKAVDKDPNIRSYELEIRNTLDGIMLGNSKLSYETLRIRLTHREELNAFNKELNDQKAMGEFFPDIDMLVAGEGKETVRHEEGHYISSLLGRKILGNRKSFDKGIRKTTSRDWERWWSYRYKSPEVGEFHEKILKLVESLDKSMTPQMKNDNRIMSDGTVMKDYRADPDEKRARFWSASIEFTKRIAQTGKIPTKTFKSEHEDEYSLKQYESLIEILQEYQRLEDKGLFYEVEVPDETRVNKRTGLKDIQQKSLFDQEKTPYNRGLTPDQKQVRTAHMIDTWKDIVVGFDIDTMLTNYNPDITKWMKGVENAGKNYGRNSYIDFYLTLKALQNDADFMEGLEIRAGRIKKAKEEGTAYGGNLLNLYELLSKEPLKLKDKKTPIKVRNEELLEPIRRWFIEHDIDRQWEMDKFRDNYSPDTIYWKQQMNGRFNKIPLSEFKELERYAQNLVKSEDINNKEPFEKYSNIQVNGMNIDRFIDTIGEGVGKTFAEKRIREIADDMWSDVMDPMKDIFQSALAGATEPLTPTRFNEFVGHIYFDLGQTYTSDIKEWSKAVEEEIKARADRMGIALNRKKVIPEQKLQGLGAKLKEILAMGKDLGEYITNEMEFDYNPTRNEWIRDLVSGAYENSQKGEATKDIEATKQLVAISNMSVENFRKQIEDFEGKSPMPSIAVTDVNVPHTAFGDLTLIFGRETVDPQVDPRNKLYASDAWTVTFPDLEEVGGIHYTEATELMQKLKDKINETDSLTLTEGGLDPATIDSLTNKIVNEILSNGLDAEYLAGYFDVAETSVQNAVDDIGLEWTDNEGLYLDLENIVEDYVKEHQIRQVIPARYFKGQVRYDDRNAIQEVVDKVWDNLPEKGIQKLKDDGWSFDESDNKYVINQRHKDAPPKEGIQRDLTDLIERIDDYPNISVESAGQQYRDLLVNEYGFDRSLATQISEDIFGQIEAEKLTPEGFADKLADYMPLNDGDMGFDFGNMYDHNLEAMNRDVASMNRQVGRRILEERDEQKNNVDGPQAMNKILDTLLDEREENTHEIIENYVTVNLREEDLGDYPTASEEKEWMKEYGEKNIEEIMGGVDASLTDMKLWIKDVANKEMLIEELNRDRPLTPENILEAMKRQGGPRRDNAEGTLRDLVGVEGKEFTDIEQVRGKNLAKTTHNDRTGNLSAIEKRYDTIIDEIRSLFTESEPDIPMEMSTQVVRQEIAWNYDPDLETFRSNLEEENPMWEVVPDDYLQAIIDAVEMGKQVPVRFSESKPERVVDLFKEVQYILVPKESFKETQRIVKGTPLEGKVYMYNRAGFKAERSNKIKQLQRRYGNVFFSMGGVVMPIAMLYLMMNGEDEGQA